ncbi:uncharacterized protein VTP21DRAFT_5008 [Calcarisporiella thermophila]|uniref:uncharacterized protein n=1 Tax=Calcarisporiella thermophila TaxID=911321 RepID=UPI0037445695
MKTPVLLTLSLLGTTTLVLAAPSKRGLLDNTLNNPQIIDHISALNSMVNSNPQTSENTNANTKASGPGDNSNLHKQGPEGAYISGYHHHHHHHYAKREAIPENDAKIQKDAKVKRGNNAKAKKTGRHSNKKKHKDDGNRELIASRMRMVHEMMKQDVHEHGSATIGKRGVLDNTLNNLNVLDHISALDSTVNSNPQNGENRSANTKANGPGDNSVLSKQGGEGIYGYHRHHHHHHHYPYHSHNWKRATDADKLKYGNFYGKDYDTAMAAIKAQMRKSKGPYTEFEDELMRRNEIDSHANYEDTLTNNSAAL